MASSSHVSQISTLGVGVPADCVIRNFAIRDVKFVVRTWAHVIPVQKRILCFREAVIPSKPHHGAHVVTMAETAQVRHEFVNYVIFDGLAGKDNGIF